MSRRDMIQELKNIIGKGAAYNGGGYLMSTKLDNSGQM